MKNLLKFGTLAFAFALMFVSANAVNAQNWKTQKKAQHEYNKDIREARRDYRQDVRRGENRREARRDFREDRRDARQEYRSTTGRRLNRGYYVSRSRRAYPQRNQVYYRNGRRYIRNN